jgi:hypothetical protein
MRPPVEDGRAIWWPEGLSQKFDEPLLNIWRVARIKQRGSILNRLGTLDVKVVTQDGIESVCKWNEMTPFKVLLRDFIKVRYPNRRAYKSHFLFGGDRLIASDTPAVRCMAEGDVVIAVVEFTYGLGKGDIGEWESESAGSAVLFDEGSLKSGDVDLPAIVAAAQGPPATTEGVLKRRQALLSSSQCAKLIEYIEYAFAVSDRPVDFKYDLSPSSLCAVIGSALVSEMVSFGEPLLQGTLSKPRFVMRRRAAAKGQCVPFHRDISRVIVNTALNNSFVGGKLACIVNGVIVLPDRPTGCATSHDNAMVHGVTELLAGVRYNLFCVFT